MVPRYPQDKAVERLSTLSPILSSALAAGGDDPDGVDEAGDVAEDRQHNVQPEVQPDADGEEDAEGWDEDREDEA